MQQLSLFDAPCPMDHPALSIEQDGSACVTNNETRDVKHEGERHDA